MSMLFYKKCFWVIAIVRCGPNDRYYILRKPVVESILPQISRYQQESEKKFYKEFPGLAEKLGSGIIVLSKASPAHDIFLEKINEICKEFGFPEETNPKLALHKLLLNMLKGRENHLTELILSFFQRKPLGRSIESLERYLSALESDNKKQLTEFILSDNYLSEEICAKIKNHLRWGDLRDAQIVHDQAYHHLLKILEQIAGYVQQDSNYKKTILTEFETSDAEEGLLFKCLLSLWSEERILQLKEVFELYKASKSYSAFTDFYQYESNPEKIQGARINLDEQWQETTLPGQAESWSDFCVSPREAPNFKKEEAIKESQDPDMRPANSDASTAIEGSIEGDIGPTSDPDIQSVYPGEIEQVMTQDLEPNVQNLTDAAADTKVDEAAPITNEPSETGASVKLIPRIKIISENKRKANPVSAKKTDAKTDAINPHISEMKIRILLKNLIASGINRLQSAKMLNFALVSSNYFADFCFIFLVECWETITYIIRAVIIRLPWVTTIALKAKYGLSQESFRNIFRYIFGYFCGFKDILIVHLGNLEPASINQVFCGRRRKRFPLLKSSVY